jgi:hypothetical protein
VSTPAARSPNAIAPTYSPPRSTARVSPEPSNFGADTTVTSYPAATACSNTVLFGCTDSGGNASRRSTFPWLPCSVHRSVSITTSSDIRIDVPSTPCPPGGRPVPSDARLIAVLDGNPTVNGPASGRDARNGASAAWAASSSEPSPSTSSSPTARAGSSANPPCSNPENTAASDRS